MSSKTKERTIIFTCIIAIVVVVLVYFIVGRLNAYRDPAITKLPYNDFDKTIIAVADKGFEPYSFLNSAGYPSGYDIELLYAIANNMQINVELKMMSTNDIMLAKSDNKIAVLTDNPYIFVDYETIIIEDKEYSMVRYPVGKKRLTKHDNSEVYILGPILSNSFLCIDPNEDMQKIASELERATRELYFDGTIDYLSQKWLERYIEDVSILRRISQNYHIFLLILLLATLFSAILVFLYFYIEIQKQKELEGLLQVTIDTMPYVITFWNKDNRIFATNEAALKAFEVSSKQELVDNFWSFSPIYQPDGQLSNDKSIVCMDKVLKDGFYRFEWIHQTAKGNTRPSEITLVKVKFKKDDIVIGYNRDLSDDLKMTARLQEKDKNLEHLLESMDTLVIATDMETDKIVFLNDQFKNLFNFDESVYNNRRCWEVLVHNGTGRCSFCPKRNLDAWKGKPIVWEFYNPIVKKHYKITCSVLDWADGSKVFVEQSYDITEYKNFIDEMKEHDEYVQILLDTIPISCVLWDEDNNAIACNQETLNMLHLKDIHEFRQRISLKPSIFVDKKTDGNDFYRDWLPKAFEEGYCRYRWTYKDAFGMAVPCEVTLVRVNYKETHLVAEYALDLRSKRFRLHDIEG